MLLEKRSSEMPHDDHDRVQDALRTFHAREQRQFERGRLARRVVWVAVLLAALALAVAFILGVGH